MTQTIGDPGASPHVNLTTVFGYDPDGRVLTVTRDPGTAPHLNLTATASYSLSGKKLTDTDPAGNVTHYGYDALDRPIQVIDAQGRVTNTVYDRLNRLASVSNPGIQSSPLETHSYSANGNALALTNARGRQTLYAYDGFDRLAKTTYPDLSSEALSYDANGNMLSRRTRKGAPVQYSYDALNRVSGKNAAGQPAVAYAYDPAGRLSSVNDSNGAFGYVYDTAGRLVSASSPVVGAIAYANDNDGHRTGMTWPDGYGVSYAYDAVSRLTAIAENGGPVLAAYGFDGASRRNSLIAGNGVQTGYVYAANDDLTGLTHGFTGGTASLGYGYDGTHRRTSQTASDSGFVGHPAAGGALTYGANALDQYDAVGQSAYLYDGNGNLANDRSLTYQYDTENRLIAAAKPGHAYSYVYDPLGRRRSKTADGVTTGYLSDGPREIAEYQGTALLRRFVRGAGPDELAVTVDAAGNHVYAHQDALGSTIAESDATGAVTARYGYGPFGETNAGGPAIFRYAGRRYDPETGLYDNRARMYAPTLGRFLQPDPIGYAGGINLYAYVGNDPLNLVDPFGYAADSPQGGGFWSNAGSVIANNPMKFIGGGLAIGGAVGCIIAEPCGLVGALAGGGAILSSETVVAGGTMALGTTMMMVAPSSGSSTQTQNQGGSSSSGGSGGGGGAPDFIVAPDGTVYPVPEGSTGPTPVINQAGNQTGVAFTGGSSGANGQVSTIRIMDSTPPRGNSPGYPNGYITYQNGASPTPQAVNPYTGQTVPPSAAHFPIQ